LLFLSSLLIAPVGFGIVSTLGDATAEGFVSKALFVLTVAVEVVALFAATAVRKRFSPADRGHLTWTLIAAFIIVRLAGEVRLMTLTFNIVPTYTEGSSAASFFYVVVLRYLYTFGDLLFIAALITTVRAYKSTGLKFELTNVDYCYLVLLWAVPLTTFTFRSNLGLGGIITADNYILTYRLVAVFVGAVIASLCVVVRRYALQMGGGAVAKVWNTVVAAGIARDASFLVLALMLNWWKTGAQFFEQYLLWIFACCWLIAALYQQEVFERISPATGTAPSAAPSGATS
jgi:hypothetical protein